MTDHRYFENGPRHCRLWSKDFHYTPAAESDIRVTFARIKAQQQKQQRMHQVKEKSR